MASILVIADETGHSPPPSHGLDEYGRILADVFLPDGANVNHTLVKDG